jgi:hypothetical protein
MAMCKILAVLLAAAALAGAQDEAEINKWIADLIHVDPARRSAAEKSLIKAGPKALPALKAALESKTPELAARAKEVAAEIERVEFEKKHDATQRVRRLEIVSLQLKDGTLGEAVKTLGQQVDSTVHTIVDPKMKLTIDVKDVPIRKCLDQIEDLLKVAIESRNTWHKVAKGPAPKRKKRAYAPGVTCEFSLAPFTRDGQREGWALMTHMTGPAEVIVESFEVADTAKAAVEVERCGRCSPRFVHLKTDKDGPFTVRLKGRTVWESPYDLAVSAPDKPQDFKVGTFAIRYEWPKATWTSSEPVAPHLIGRADLAIRLKNQPKPPTSGGNVMGMSPPPDRLPNSWCNCPSGSPVPASAPVKAAPLTAGSHVENALRKLKLDQVDTVTVKFYKAIEEPFQAEAVVPAD